MNKRRENEMKMKTSRPNTRVSPLGGPEIEWQQGALYEQHEQPSSGNEERETVVNQKREREKT